MPPNKYKRFPPWHDPFEELEPGMPDRGQGLRFLVRYLNRSFTRLVETELRAHVEITYAQWAFLRVLWYGDGLSQRELSERVGLMENTTLVAVNILQKRGWIRRKRDNKDRRRLLVFLTPKGRDISRLRPVIQNVNAIAIGGLSAAEIATVRRCLRKMLDNLDDALELKGATPVPRKTGAKAKRGAR